MPHATNNLMRKAVPPQITRVHEGRSVYKELYPSENTINFCQAGILKKIPAFFFSYFKPVKIISLVLSFSILFTSLAPSYAEGVAAMQRRQEQALATGVERAVAQATLAQVTPQARAEQLVRKAYSTEIKLGIAGLIAKGCQNDLMQAGVKDGELAATKQVCNKAGVCVSADLYGQACAKIAIDAAWDGQAEVMNEVKKTAQGYEGVALDLSKLIVTVGAELIDSEKIYEYEEGVLKSKGVCEDSGWTRQISKAGRERVKEEAPMQSARCEAALTALEAVAVLGVMYPRKYQARAEETIYQFMQAKKRDAMGGVGVYKGVLLLMGLNSAHSYELLAKFLKESTPNIGGTTAEALGHAVSLEGWLSTAPAALRGRYLNIYTQRYSYRDMELAKQWGLACENLEEDTVQCPQGNIYEDIGEVIAMDLQNPRSKTLARQIFEDGQNYHIAGRYARPLWVGLLTGNKGAFARVYGVPALNALKDLQRADYDDMNEGTVRRLHLKAALAERNYSGASSDVAAMSKLVSRQYALRDQTRYEQYAKQSHRREVASKLDFFLAAVFAGALIYKASAKAVQLVTKLRMLAVGSAKTQTAVATQELARAAQKSVAAAKQPAAQIKIVDVGQGQTVAQMAAEDGKVVEIGLETTAKTTSAKPLIYQGTERTMQATEGVGEAKAAGKTFDYSKYIVRKEEPSFWEIAQKTASDNWKWNRAEGRLLNTKVKKDFWSSLKYAPAKMLLGMQLVFTPIMPGVDAFVLPAAKTATEVVMTAPKAVQGALATTKAVQSTSRIARISTEFNQATQAIRNTARNAAAQTAARTAEAIPFRVWAPLAAVTPDDMRRYGIGERGAMRFNTLEQIRSTYSTQLSDYAKYLAITQPQLGFNHYDSTFDILDAHHQYQHFGQYLQSKQQYFLNQGGVYQPRAWWNVAQGLQTWQNDIYFGSIAPIRYARNKFYQAEQAAPFQTAEYKLGQLFFGDEILDKIERAERDFLRTQPFASAYAFSVVPPVPFWQKLQRNYEHTTLAKKHRRQLQDMRQRVWQNFVEKYEELTPQERQNQQKVLTNRDFIQNYYVAAVNMIEESGLPVAVKQIVLRGWEQQLQTFLQSIASETDASIEKYSIPVYEKKQLVGFWPLDTQSAKNMERLHPDQHLFIRLPKKGKQAELVMRPNEKQEKDKPNGIVIRSDIELQRGQGVQTPSPFGWKKIAEGILLVNNRILPLFGLYLMQGMGNMSSIIANFSKVDFHLANWEMYALGGISPVVTGVFSFIAGILQNRWARNSDGTINGARGRNITLNIGMAAFIAGMVLPMLAGMHGLLGDPTDIKKYLLITSFILLGIGGAFLDVSMKPVVLAASTDDRYQALQGYLSVFKQTVGNAMNYLVPPIAMGLMAAFGKQIDWTVFFPVYGAISLLVMLLYNTFGMHQQTLETTEKRRKEDRLSLKTTWKELTGTNLYNRIIRRGVLATALHGMNMSILGLYINQLFMKQVEGTFDMYASAGSSNVWAAMWQSLSHSWLGHSLLWFTVPIILGRIIGTRLMEKGIHSKRINIAPIDKGALLAGSGLAVIAGLAAIAFGIWPVKLAGIVLSAIGLTNISPIITGFTFHNTRHVSDAVSTLLSATAMITFAGNALFGWFKDLTEMTSVPWLPLLMPVIFLGYLIYFGWEIGTHKLEDQAETVLDPATDKEKVALPEKVYQAQEEAWAEDLEEFTKDIPIDKMRKLFAGFRGMHDLSLEDIKHILEKGLEKGKTRYNKIYFAKDILAGRSTEEFKQILKKRNDMQFLAKGGANPFMYLPGKEGNPVLIGLKPGVRDEREGTHPNYIYFEKDIPARKIVVFGYLNLNDKKGWYQMSLRRDGKLIIVPMKEYLQEATEKEKSKKEKRKTQSIPKVEDVLAARFATEKEIAQQRLELLDQYHTWYQNNVSYIANPVTKQALDAVESLTSRAATQAEIDQAAAAINKLSTLSLGVEDALETSSYKVIFLGKDAANAQADDFYRANERRTIPREWVPSRLPKDVSLIMNTRGEVTGLMLGKGASELKVQQVINAIIKRSGLKVRMGAHELGITSIGQRRYREGNLHIHFESTAPNESGIYYNFRLSIQAGKLTKKASLPQLRHMYLRFFGPYLDTADIEWPSDSQPDLYSMNRTLNDGLFAQQFA